MSAVRRDAGEDLAVVDVHGIRAFGGRALRCHRGSDLARVRLGIDLPEPVGAEVVERRLRERRRSGESAVRCDAILFEATLEDARFRCDLRLDGCDAGGVVLRPALIVVDAREEHRQKRREDLDARARCGANAAARERRATSAKRERRDACSALGDVLEARAVVAADALALLCDGADADSANGGVGSARVRVDGERDVRREGRDVIGRADAHRVVVAVEPELIRARRDRVSDARDGENTSRRAARLGRGRAVDGSAGDEQRLVALARDLRACAVEGVGVVVAKDLVDVLVRRRRASRELRASE